jgi:hypothetical protein
MNEPSLALQKAIRARLISTAAVTALVPADHILDRNQRPAPDPSIVLGEDQVVNEGVTLSRDVVHVYTTLHIWKRELGLAGVKVIAAEVGRALQVEPLVTQEGDYQLFDTAVQASRFMRDPDGETAHCVLTVRSLVRVLS